MHRKTISLAGIGLAAWCATGCANNSEKIVFLSEPAAARPITVKAAVPSLSDAERAAIKQAVFNRLLQGHFGDDGGYSAIFLQADEAHTAALMKQFPNHNPPIKQLWHSDIRPGFTPRDKDTGSPAMIFSVESADPENDTVQAIGRWYAGDAVKGFYPYLFNKTPAGWVLSAAQ